MMIMDRDEMMIMSMVNIIIRMTRWMILDNLEVRAGMTKLPIIILMIMMIVTMVTMMMTILIYEQ